MAGLEVSSLLLVPFKQRIDFKQVLTLIRQTDDENIYQNTRLHISLVTR